MSASAVIQGCHVGHLGPEDEHTNDGWQTVTRGRPSTPRELMARPRSQEEDRTEEQDALPDSKNDGMSTRNQDSQVWPEKVRKHQSPRLVAGADPLPLPRARRARASSNAQGQEDDMSTFAQRKRPHDSGIDGQPPGVPGTLWPQKLNVQSNMTTERQTNGYKDLPPPQNSVKTPRETLRVRRLSAVKIQELTSSPESLSLHAAPFPDRGPPTSSPAEYGHLLESRRERRIAQSSDGPTGPWKDAAETLESSPRKSLSHSINDGMEQVDEALLDRSGHLDRSTIASSPAVISDQYARKSRDRLDEPAVGGRHRRQAPSPLQLNGTPSAPHSRLAELRSSSPQGPSASPMPPSIPLPPLSLPTYLQLELSSARPSPLYIHRSAVTDFPYESSKIKFERLVNFLLLPPQLELTLWFGALACLDAWLYSFTILPLRFFVAVSVLGRWWSSNLAREAKDISRIIYEGLGRMWKRSGRRDTEKVSSKAPKSPRKTRSRGKWGADGNHIGRKSATFSEKESGSGLNSASEQRRFKSSVHRHRRSKSTPSALLADHKADLLKGLVVLFSCLVLMRFDASRMYHGIRGQAAIKLYVIYNVLEVCDRLFSALGQDVFECLFSKETLERTPDGRSKLLRPFGMFLLALTYNVIHSTALFYQVVTLNVAVNSYSNALLTLLMSNQFVEIKSTVFKKFEKENLFQLTCADVVERFQLWLMLLIIALRNIVEVGGLSLGGSGSSFWSSSGAAAGPNNTQSGGPVRGASIVPKSFTIFPKWTGQVLGPFLLVLGSEMLVDWLKHAYISKFNNMKPAIYGRFLDVLAKDYYSNAFSDQNLTRRLGLPVIPLSCLFIRASLQTYHMFLATNVPLPIPSSATSLSVESASAATSPATTAALQHFDNIIRRALGRSSFGAGSHPSPPPASTSASWWSTHWTADDLIAFLTMLVFFLGVYLVLLSLKLVLGMLLLAFARRRYRGMKERELAEYDTGGRRVGGWGVVEVDDDKRRWIYQDDPDGARASREREQRAMMMSKRDDVRASAGDGASDARSGGDVFSGISRYTMVAKRIW